MSMTKTKNDAPTFGAVSILFGSQLAIASAAIFAKFALLGAGAMMVSALRLTIAAAIALVICARSKKFEKVSRRDEMLFALCGLASAVYFASWIASLNLTSVAISTLLVSTTPVWTTLYDLVFLRKRPFVQFWIGFVAVALGAVVAVSGPSQSVSNTESEQLLGALLSTIGGFAFACYLIAVRTVSDSYSTFTIVNRTYAWAAVFLWLGVFVVQDQLPAADPTCWGGILGMSLVSQLLGHTGMNLSLKTFSSSIVAMSTLLEPAFAAVLALFIFHEGLNSEMVIGAVLIMAGLLAVMKAKVLEPRLKQEPVPEV